MRFYCGLFLRNKTSDSVWRYCLQVEYTQEGNKQADCQSRWVIAFDSTQRYTRA